MIHKLYSLTDTVEKAKEPLYIRGIKERKEHSILMHKGEVLDFTTYFNSLSLKKWKRYTTIKPGFPKYVTCHLTTVDLICFQEQPAAV